MERPAECSSQQQLSLAALQHVIGGYTHCSMYHGPASHLIMQTDEQCCGEPQPLMTWREFTNRMYRTSAQSDAVLPLCNWSRRQNALFLSSPAMFLFLKHLAQPAEWAHPARNVQGVSGCRNARQAEQHHPQQASAAVG